MANLTSFEDFLNDFLAEAKEVDKAPGTLNEVTDLKVGDYFISPRQGAGYGKVTKVGSRDVKFKPFDKEGRESQQTEGRVNHVNEYPGTKISVHPAEHAANMKAGVAEAHAKGLKDVVHSSGTYYHDGKRIVATHDIKTGKLTPIDHTKEADEELKKPFKEGSLEYHRRLRDLHNQAGKDHRDLGSKAQRAEDEGVNSNHYNISAEHFERSNQHAEAAARKYKESQMSRGEHPLDAALKSSGSSQMHEQAKLASQHRDAAKFHREHGNEEMAAKHEKRARLHQAVHDTHEAHENALNALRDEMN